MKPCRFTECRQSGLRPQHQLNAGSLGVFLQE